METNNTKIKIASKTDDYAKWYLDIAKAWDLFEYSPTPGCIVFKPKSVTLWETIKINLDNELKKLWVQNLYLPLLIPMSFFEREKEHVEWFAPELAVVTHGWGKDLEDKLAIRPTSETMFCEYFKTELESYRDLPILMNQWVNVLRWEKRTRPFLRTAEFYWQEWHTLHETKDEARQFSLDILNNVYIKNIRELMAIDWIAWTKSESEKFAWAETTFTFEPMMSNWRALQICTSHLLGKGFMEQFDVSFLSREGKKDYPFYTSWGLSTRSIGWIISSHSDQKWLIIPPKMSEYKAIILPIFWKDNEDKIKEWILEISTKILWKINNTNWIPVKWEYFKSFIWESWNKVLVDYRNARFWEKITDFELGGYPVAVVIWEKELQENSCTVISRITWEKTSINLDNLDIIVDKILEEWQSELFRRSQERLRSNVIPCHSIEEIGKAIEEGKFAIYEWDCNPQFEVEIKEKFKATTRCVPFLWQFTDDLLTLKNPNNVKIIIARAF